MKKCSKCNLEFQDDAMFCDVCGGKLEEKESPVFCMNCGSRLEPGAEFCSECGQSLNTEATQNKNETGTTVKTKGDKLRKALTGVAVACVTVGLVAGGYTLFHNMTSNNVDKLLYLKDDELYMANGNPEKSVKFKTEEIGGIRADLITCQEQYNRIIYPDESGYYGGSYTLYYRSMSNKEEEPVKIDNDIVSYQISENGKKLFYQTSDYDLYTYDFKEGTKVSKDVDYYIISEDGKKSCYVSDYKLYYWKNGETEQLDEDVKSWSVTADSGFSTIYYKDTDENLYRYSFDDKPVKIADNVADYVTYESGVIYYVEGQEVERKLSEFVEDDCTGKSVKEPKEPKMPEAPLWSDYGYAREKAYDKAYKRYETAYEKYEEELEVYWEKYDEL